jgi:hypothetical protein
MAFMFAYTLDGDGADIVKDYPLDTVGNFPLAKQTKGTLVKLVSGLLQPVGAAGGAGVGVMEGTEFTGLVASGQPYAATNASATAYSINATRNPNGVGKVRIDKAAMVFKVPVRQAGAVQTATNANIGVGYAILLNGNDQQIDLNTTTTPSLTVIDYSADGKYVFGTLI